VSIKEEPKPDTKPGFLLRAFLPLLRGDPLTPEQEIAVEQVKQAELRIALGGNAALRLEA